MDKWLRTMPPLELALLRRGVSHRDATRERCAGCLRTPLIGERVYLADGGRLLCELCRTGERAPRVQARVVRGPDLGGVVRVVDQRAA